MKEKRNVLNHVIILDLMVIVYLGNVAKICRASKENLKNSAEYLGFLKEY